MPIPAKVKNYLAKEKIKHEILEHKTVYTAFDMAQTLKEKLEEIGKALALKADKRHILIVVPANKRLNMEKLKKYLKVKTIKFLKESEMIKLFKIKPGAIAPFGKIYGVPVYIDKTLLKNKVIIVSAGTYTDSVKMKLKDFLQTGAEELGSFAEAIKFKVKAQPKKKTKPKKAVSKTRKPITAKKKKK